MYALVTEHNGGFALREHPPGLLLLLQFTVIMCLFLPSSPDSHIAPHFPPSLCAVCTVTLTIATLRSVFHPIALRRHFVRLHCTVSRRSAHFLFGFSALSRELFSQCSVACSDFSGRVSALIGVLVVDR